MNISQENLMELGVCVCDWSQKFLVISLFCLLLLLLQYDKEENNYNEPLKCDVCSVVCKSNANLKKHKQRTHDDREYTCDTCGIKFYVCFYLAN